jgi:hypothetical protein
MPGFVDESFCFNLKTGNYHNNTILVNNIGPTCKTNDTYGAGIIYLTKNMYQPFFTYNGSIISFAKDEVVYIKKSIVPIIYFNASNKIYVNFSQNEFKFDIKNYLFNDKIICDKNTFLKSKLNLENINTKNIIIKKLFKNSPNVLNILSIIDNNLSTMIMGIMNENND